MTADEFATLVRSGKGSVRVSNAVLRAEGCRIRGHGVIERDLRFSSARVSPGRRTDQWKTGKAARTTQVLHLSHLELQTAGWDKLTDAQKRKAIGLPPGKR